MADWAEQFETFATYYWLTATLGILVLLVVSLLAPLRKWIVEGFPQTRKNWIILSGILLACSLFCFTHSSPQTRMASDEQLQQSVASNFYHLKRADYCNEGNFFDGEISCTKFQPAIYPKLYSYFLSVYYGMSGESQSGPYNLNFLFYLLTAVGLFRLGFEFSRSFSGALATLVVWCLWPVNIWWSRAGGYEMTYVLMVTLTACAAFFVGSLTSKVGEPRDPGSPHTIFPSIFPAVLLGFLAGLATQTRNEAGVLLPALLLPALPYFSKKMRMWIAFLASYALAAFPAFVLLYRLRGYDHQALPGQQPFSLQNLLKHWGPNWRYFFNIGVDSPSVTLFMVAALLGLLWYGRDAFSHAKQRLRLCMLGAWIFTLICVVFSFHAADFNFIISIRYTMGFLLPFSILAGYLVSRTLETYSHPFVVPVFGLMGVATGLFHAAELEGDRRTRLINLLSEDQIIGDLIQRFDRRSIFIYSRPPHFLLRKRTSVSYEGLLAFEPEELGRLQRISGDRVYYIRGLDCWSGSAPILHEISFGPLCAQIERMYDIKVTETARIRDQYDLNISKLVAVKVPTSHLKVSGK